MNIPLNNRLPSLVLYASFIAYSFQAMSLEIMSSTYDVSCFLFVIFGLLITFQHQKELYRSTFLFLLFLSYEFLLIFLYDLNSFARMYSGVIWIFGLYISTRAGYLFRYSQFLVAKILFISTLFSAIIIIFEYFWFNEPRPRAYFAEPTLSGLAIFAEFIGIFICLFFYPSRFSITNYVLLVIVLIILLIAGYITKSISIFILIPLILILILIKNKFIYLFIFGLSLLFVFYFFSGNEHYYDRILFFQNSSLNSSVLSWLRGYDQMIHVLNFSPILGFGVGSTGQFDFISSFNSELLFYGVINLNINDAYSMLFRLIIEIGLLPLGFFIYVLILRIYKFKFFILKNTNNIKIDINYLATLFNFTFSLFLLIGIFLKEPIYSRSFLFLSIFLIFSSRINSKKSYNESLN